MKRIRVNLLFIAAILGLLVLCSCEKNTINNDTEVFYDTQTSIQLIKAEYAEPAMTETSVGSNDNEDGLYFSALEKIDSYFGKYIAMNSDEERIAFEETDMFDQSSEGGEIVKFKDSDNNLIRCSRVLYGSIGNTEENYYLLGDSEVYFTRLEQYYDSYRPTDVTGTLNYYFSEYLLDGDKIYCIDRLNEQMVICNEDIIPKSIQSMIEEQSAITAKEYENTDNTETAPKSDMTDISYDPKYESGLNRLFEIIETGHGGFLYDFDMDNIPELAVKRWGVNLDYSYEIYNCEDGMLMGEIYLGAYEGDWLVSPQLTLYYDKDNNKYFYVADSDFWHKDYHCAAARRYEFENSSITATVIAQCRFEYTVGSDELNFTENELLGNKTTPMGVYHESEITCYYDGLADYLTGFEKVSIIDETPLWDNSQVETGEYKDIIISELAKYSDE